jgi:hypothetical protein
LERADVLTLGVLSMVIVLIVVVLVLVLRAARDNKLGRFKFRIYASLAKIFTFGMEVESQQSAGSGPGDEPPELPPIPEPPKLPPLPKPPGLPLVPKSPDLPSVSPAPLPPGEAGQ